MQKHPIAFDVLTDFENAYADKLGLRFQMPDYLIEVYKGFKLDFPNFHGESSWTLAMPSRLVIDANGIVRHIEANADYTYRPEPQETLEVLKANV